MKGKQDPTSSYMYEIKTREEKDTIEDIIPFY
jgi:hypothetical protein